MHIFSLIPVRSTDIAVEIVERAINIEEAIQKRNDEQCTKQMQKIKNQHQSLYRKDNYIKLNN